MNNDVPAVIEEVQLVPRSALRIKTAASLKPGASMMEAAAFGQPEACEIRDAWRFQPNKATPLIEVSVEEFQRMIERNPVTFHE